METEEHASETTRDVMLRIVVYLARIEELLRAQFEQRRETEVRFSRMLAALSLVAGNGQIHDDD